MAANNLPAEPPEPQPEAPGTQRVEQEREDRFPLWNLIPQLFYDIVARIFPGAVLIGVGWLIWVKPETTLSIVEKNHEWIVGFGAAVVFAGASYLVGLVVGQFAGLILYRPIKAYERRTEKKCKAACSNEHNRLLVLLGLEPFDISPSDFPRWFVMHDHLREVAGPEAARLLKLLAEIEYCKALLVGLLTLSLINAIKLYQGFTGTLLTRRFSLELGIVFAALMSGFQLKQNILHFMTGTSVLWLSLASTDRLTFQSRRKASRHRR